MVAGYHLIWIVYGYWLPNDPRGSTSTEVRVEPIRDLGEIHYGRKPVQSSSAEIRAFHKNARDVLKHPVLIFKGDETAFLGDVFAETIAENTPVTPWRPCPIMCTC